ncbi:MAG: FAD-dependent oxidoreductase [Coriobacteriales bacterium]|jgi:succinate dehydrogenase/fumarate reductase flavoprotein subunit|nr:FAD-dependent oxidoreductase [Coriobacteriales bacterium]
MLEARNKGEGTFTDTFTDKNIDRRGFLKRAALGAAGVGAAAALGACSSQSGSGTTNNSPAASTGATNSAEQQWGFEIPPAPIAESTITATEEADVVVVGAGMSGLVSAASCLENGLKVIVVSASKAAVSRGGSNHGVDTKITQAMGLPKYDPEPFYRYQYVANGGNFKPAFWYKFYNNSAEAMNWLVDIAAKVGIKCTIESGPEYTVDDPMYTPGAAHAFYKEDSELEGGVGTGEPHIAAELARFIVEDLGGTIVWQTKAEQLEKEGGKVVSVIAVDMTSGKYRRYKASKAVILATGDFSHDKDMMTRYCPEALPLLLEIDNDVNYDAGLQVGGLMPGDGHKMALWAGAAWQSAPNVIMLGRPNLPADQPYTSHTGLMVDANGQRFMNEDVLGGIACATIMNLPDITAWCIWGKNRAADGGPWAKPNYAQGVYFSSAEEFIKTWDDDAYGFGVKKNDSLEGLIADLGLPPSTIDTVERFNQLCAKGHDDDFYKKPEKMIGINEPPYYGCSFTPMFLTSLGGIRANTNLQALNTEDKPIEGLYVVGSVLGNFYSSVYTFAMEGINYGATCVTLPYVLGKELAGK